MNAVRLLVLIVALVASSLAFGQYRPSPGETALKIEVEGRGVIWVRLHTREAPRTTAEILRLVRGGYYNGLAFHRVERTPRPYLAQVGDPGTRNTPAPAIDVSNLKIAYEATPYSHETGAVGLARMNPMDRDSGGAQFYLMLGPAKFLDGNYTVFGQVVMGLDVLARLQRGDRIVSITAVTG